MSLLGLKSCSKSSLCVDIIFVLWEGNMVDQVVWIDKTYCRANQDVLATKSGSDVILCLQLLSKTITCILHLS